MRQHPHSLAILGRNYQLPALPPRLRDLPELIAKRADLVQNGEENRPRWLGLFKRRPKQLSIERRYDETEALIHDYQRALQHLSQHRQSYHRFFIKLAEGVQSAVRRKGDEIRTLESQRQALSERARELDDIALAERAGQLAERLVVLVRKMGQATLLILRKVELCQAGIDRLVDDQHKQQETLEQHMFPDGVASDEARSHLDALASSPPASTSAGLPDNVEVADLAVIRPPSDTGKAPPIPRRRARKRRAGRH